MPLRAVFFDLDDTLCDTIGTRPERARRAFRAIAPHRPDLDLEQFVALVMEPTGPRIVRGVPAVVETLGLTDTTAGREAVDIWWFKPSERLLHCFQGVPKTLESLGKQYILGIITNGEEWYQRPKFEQLPITRLITHFVFSDTVGLAKPDPGIFRHALSLANVQAREAAFVGDELDADVDGAKAAGMRAVWFNHWGGHLDDRGPQPDAVIERFSQLPEVLERLFHLS